MKYGIPGTRIYVIDIIELVLLLVGSILLGFVYSSIANGNAEVQKNSTIKTKEITASKNMVEESNVDKLMRLKAFLDDGIISQEEFDEKKKQLLNL